eukprot:1646364-Amphidinium_carterae.1
MEVLAVWGLSLAFAPRPHSLAMPQSTQDTSRLATHAASPHQNPGARKLLSGHKNYSLTFVFLGILYAISVSYRTACRIDAISALFRFS